MVVVVAVVSACARVCVGWGLRRKALPAGHCARLIRPSGHTKAITMASVDTPWVGLSSGDPGGGGGGGGAVFGQQERQQQNKFLLFFSCLSFARAGQFWSRRCSAVNTEFCGRRRICLKRNLGVVMMKEAIAWAIIVLCIATCTAAQADDLDVDSLCEKGLSFAAGENQDVELALKLMLEAAEAGSPACARHVGFSYLYGKGAAEENRELGLQWYATAGERGDVSALLEMAALYGTMNTFPDLFDPPRAESYAKQGAELGSPEAARVYLKMLLGRNVTEEEHISWLRKCAVETENSACMGEYAQVMIQGKYGHRVRLVKGLDMLHDAAERGDAPSLIEAGKLALKEDAAKAEKFFSKAAEKGYPGALFLLSRAYAARQDENGVTSEADFASETALLNLCARQHKDLQCLHLLGLYQVFGVGTLDVNATDGLSVRSDGFVTCSVNGILVGVLAHFDFNCDGSSCQRQVDEEVRNP